MFWISIIILEFNFNYINITNGIRILIFIPMGIILKGIIFARMFILGIDRE